MEIKYEKIGDYYIFDNNHTNRVYLGDIPIEDYIWDCREQEKRTASKRYYNIETNETVSEEEALGKEDDDEINILWFGEEFTHESDKKSNYKYGCEYTYDFVRKTSLSGLGSPNKNCQYNSKDKAVVRLAKAYYFHNDDLAAYDARQEQFKKDREEQKRRWPSLHNLMCVGGEPPYYVDDNGNRITPLEHVARMKKELGDDCFERAREMERENPELIEICEKVKNNAN